MGPQIALLFFGVAQGGGAVDQGNPCVAIVDQMGHRLEGPGAFVHADGVDPGIGITDQQHDRVVAPAQGADMIQLPVTARKNQHPVGAPCPEGLDHLRLDGQGVVRGCKQGRIAAFGQFDLDRLRHSCQNRVLQVGQDQPDRPRLALNQRAGDMVGQIVQPLRRLQDRGARVIRNPAAAAQGKADGVDRKPRLFGDVFQAGNGLGHTLTFAQHPSGPGSPYIGWNWGAFPSTRCGCRPDRESTRRGCCQCHP